MSIFGMTGFGRADGEAAGLRWAWEARSVNGRGLDVRVRWAPGWEAVEGPARKAVQARFTRGSVNLTLTVQPAGDAGAQVRVDHAVVQAYLEAMEPYSLDGMADRPRLDTLLTLPGVLKTSSGPADEETAAAQQQAILSGLDAALDGLAVGRAEEGAALFAVLSEILDRIAALAAEAGAEAAAQPAMIRERLHESLRTLMDEGGLDETRFAQEAAILAGKADVREELDRLAAHVEAARGLLAGGSPCGRKLDFLAQEFNREANTLCSKSASLELTRIGLDLKAAIEQLREQVQNVE